MCDATNSPIVLVIALNFVDVQLYVRDGKVDLLTVLFSQLSLLLYHTYGDVLLYLPCCLWTCMLHAHSIAYKLWYYCQKKQTLLTLLTRNAKYFHTVGIREVGGFEFS